jgi:VWFA-related protein
VRWSGNSRPSPRLRPTLKLRPASRTASRASGLVALLAGVSLAAAPVATPQAPAANAVTLEVLVTRGGTPVEGLTASDVLLRDAGVLQTVQQVEPAAARPLSLQLVFDASASVRGPALDHLKQAATTGLAALGPADDASLITFSHVVTRRIGWTSSKTDWAGALASIVAQGSTALVDAVAASLMPGAAPGRRWLVIVFSDGDDTASWLSPADAIENARRSSAVVSSVLLDAPGNVAAAVSKTARTAAPYDQWLIAEPNLYRSALLPRLATDTGGDLITIGDTSRLAAAVTEIVARYNRRYLITYTPAGVSPRGWHPIQIEVKGADVVARSGSLR